MSTPYQCTINVDADTFYTVSVAYNSLDKVAPFRILQRLYYNGRLEVTKQIGKPMAVLMDAVSVVGSIVDNQSEVTL